MRPTVQDILIYLEDAGWTELIDSRFEQQVIQEIQKAYPNVERAVLNKVLNIVLI